MCPVNLVLQLRQPATLQKYGVQNCVCRETSPYVTLASGEAGGGTTNTTGEDPAKEQLVHGWEPQLKWPPGATKDTACWRVAENCSLGNLLRVPLPGARGGGVSFAAVHVSQMNFNLEPDADGRCCYADMRSYCCR